MHSVHSSTSKICCSGVRPCVWLCLSHCRSLMAVQRLQALQSLNSFFIHIRTYTIICTYVYLHNTQVTARRTAHSITNWKCNQFYRQYQINCFILNGLFVVCVYSYKFVAVRVQCIYRVLSYLHKFMFGANFFILFLIWQIICFRHNTRKWDVNNANSKYNLPFGGIFDFGKSVFSHIAHCSSCNFNSCLQFPVYRHKECHSTVKFEIHLVLISMDFPIKIENDWNLFSKFK